MNKIEAEALRRYLYNLALGYKDVRMSDMLEEVKKHYEEQKN